MDAIGSISEVIGQINDIQTTIASAVEEQTATTGEISRSVAEAATGATDIAHNVTTVAQAANDTSGGAASTLEAAGQLAHLADDMQRLVGRFVYQNTHTTDSSTNTAAEHRTQTEPAVERVPQAELAGV